jgi:hypothetical protein
MHVLQTNLTIKLIVGKEHAMTLEQLPVDLSPSSEGLNQHDLINMTY